MPMLVVNSVVPVFLVIAAGVALDRAGMITESVRGGLNRIAYWVCLPALLFSKTAAAQVAGGLPVEMAVVLAAGMAACIAAAYASGRALRLPPPSLAAYVHTALRGNLAFIALPVVLFATRGLPAAERARLEAGVLLAIVPTIILYNLVSVPLLIAHTHRCGAHPLRRMAAELATNPLILACGLGLAVRAAGWRLPVAAERACTSLADAAFPMALLAIGSQLARPRLGRHVGWAFGAALIKVAVAPAAGYAVARWGFHFQPWELRAALVLLATPTAVASYVLTEQLGGDAELAAGTIVASTLLAAGSLTAALLVPL